MRNIIEIKNGVPKNPVFRMKNAINICMQNDEHWAIVGANGAGKSVLVDILTSVHPLLINDVAYDFGDAKEKGVSSNIRCVTFCDTYGEASSLKYYQQRWNHGDNEEEAPTVEEILNETRTNNADLDELIKELLPKVFLEKTIMMLSSGEFRRFQLVKSLSCSPSLLILDNPFIGLDAEARTQVTDFLSRLTNSGVIQIVLVLSRQDSLPSFITHVVSMEKMNIKAKYTKEEYLKSIYNNEEKVGVLCKDKENEIINLPYKDNEYNTKGVIDFNNINISYGSHAILKDLCWKVDCGEKWALCGRNGSGKSTLLSLVCADNPQGYACDITLFGNKRGSGESIWDIKKHIGYVSPEMYRAYKKNLPTIDIVASGLYDSVGLYHRLSDSDKEKCLWWMDKFGIKELANRPYLKISSGEQRLALLVRAFVKDPELLILDEPFHGLDNHNRLLAKEIINVFCKRKNKTLIMVSHYTEDFPLCITKTLCLKKP